MFRAGCMLLYSDKVASSAAYCGDELPQPVSARLTCRKDLPFLGFLIMVSIYSS